MSKNLHNNDDGAVAQKVQQTVTAHDLLAPGALVLLLVSGGSDSVAMAHLLPLLYPQNNFAVLHVNHGLRSQAADEDERFVVELCAMLGLPCWVERVDVAATAAQTGDNVEQAGRKLRYARAHTRLECWCDEQGVAPTNGRIATAHTLDDRAETLLMRVIVGGGSGSLGSIPYCNGVVVRPLLDCRHNALRTWLLTQEGAGGQGAVELSQAARVGKLWCEDESNADTTYARAYVRHELLPLLKKRNPRILETLAKNANVLACESAYLDEQAHALLPLTSASFLAPEALLRRAIYLAYKEVADGLAPDARISFEHIDCIAREGARLGFARHLPGGIEVRNVKGRLVFCVAKPPRHIPHASK
jgi:tRNA(Ile)-lysidine synthase